MQSSAFVKAITTAKSKLVRDGISSEIYNAYVAPMSNAAHQPHPDIRYEESPEDVTAVLELQEQLRQMAILKRFSPCPMGTLTSGKMETNA